MLPIESIEELEKVQDELNDLKRDLRDVKKDTELDATEFHRALDDALDYLQGAKEKAGDASQSAADAESEADETCDAVDEAVNKIENLRDEINDLKRSQRESDKTINEMYDRVNRVLYTVANVIAGINLRSFQEDVTEVLNELLRPHKLQVVSIDEPEEVKEPVEPKTDTIILEEGPAGPTPDRYA